jgi:hypothetical protein
MKEVKITPPEGYEVDKENSTFECIKFKPINPPLPTTWEEFCVTNPTKVGEAYVSNDSSITQVSDQQTRFPYINGNILPSKEYAEAMLALCQLIQLRNCYNDGWEPDWTNGNECKYIIYCTYGKIIVGTHYISCSILSFKTKELRDTFFENFKDLIETAKPLL